MRRFAALLGVLTFLVVAGLGRPTPTAACAGCPQTLAVLVSGADRVDLIRVQTATANGGYVFLVEQVFRGPRAERLTFPLAGGSQTFPVGSRWVLVLYPGHGLDSAEAVQVEPNGTVVPYGPFELPTTLAGWFAAFELPATDTAAPSPSGTGWPWLALTIAVVGTLGWLVAVRRLAHRR